MSEIGILFKPEMVLPILSGSKDVTRRLGERWKKVKHGDVLYVKEGWAPFLRGTTDGEHFERLLRYLLDEAEVPWPLSLEEFQRIVAQPRGYMWRSSMFMPKGCARLWLVVLSNRRERLQDITEEDAKREGVNAGERNSFLGASHRDGFSFLWDDINPARSWASNPEVSRIEFRRLEGRP